MRLDRAPSRELLVIEWCAPGHKDIDFYLALLMDQVNATAVIHSASQRRLRHIKLGGERVPQGSDVVGFERRNEVNVDRRARLAGERRGEGAADDVADADCLQGLADACRDFKMVEEHQGHPKCSSSISG
jgi:hypothetical protein